MHKILLLNWQSRSQQIDKRKKYSPIAPSHPSAISHPFERSDFSGSAYVNVTIAIGKRSIGATSDFVGRDARIFESGVKHD